MSDRDTVNLLAVRDLHAAKEIYTRTWWKSS